MFDILNLVGVIACACTGALQAGRQKMDYFGVLIISAVTALGGGSIRDVLLGHYPLSWVQDPWLLYVVVASAIATIIIAPFFHYLKSIFLFLDALGLVAFALLGAQVALQMHYGLVLACVAGIATGAFGGVLRDILCNRIPLAFKTELYASIALLCTLLYVLLYRYILSESSAMMVAAFIGLVIRLLAIRYSWSLPTFDYSDDKYVMANWMDGMPHKRLARRLAKLREELKLKQKEVAHRRLIAQAAKNKLLKDVLEEGTSKNSAVLANSESKTSLVSGESNTQLGIKAGRISDALGKALETSLASTLAEKEASLADAEKIGVEEKAREERETSFAVNLTHTLEASSPQVGTLLTEAKEEGLSTLTEDALTKSALEASAQLESSHQELVEHLNELKACEEALAAVDAEHQELIADLSTDYASDFSAAQAFSEVVGEEIESFSTWVKEVVEQEDASQEAYVNQEKKETKIEVSSLSSATSSEPAVSESVASTSVAKASVLRSQATTPVVTPASSNTAIDKP